MSISKISFSFNKIKNAFLFIITQQNTSLYLQVTIHCSYFCINSCQVAGLHTFLCFQRPSLVIKVLPHFKGHSNVGLSPSGHLELHTSMWAFNLKKCFLQYGQLSPSFNSCSLAMCWSRLSLKLKVFWHWAHLIILSWIFSLWSVKSYFVEKRISQCSHKRSLKVS